MEHRTVLSSLSPCCHLPPIDHTLRRATFLWLSPCCHLPPIDHTLRRATFVVIPHILCMTHPSRNPQTHQRVAQYRQSRTRTSGVRQNSQYPPKLRQMTCLPNVPQRTFVNRVLDKSHSDTNLRFAMPPVLSVMYTDSLRTRLGDPQVGPILAVKCILDHADYHDGLSAWTSELSRCRDFVWRLDLQ